MHEESFNPDEIQYNRQQVAYCCNLSPDMLLFLYPAFVASLCLNFILPKVKYGTDTSELAQNLKKGKIETTKDESKHALINYFQLPDQFGGLL